MSIVILILTVIGILLLALLALAALLLFYPVSYSLAGSWEEEWTAKAAFWWLFRILRLEFLAESGEVKAKLSIFGICLWSRPDKQEEDAPKGETPEIGGMEAERAKESAIVDVDGQAEEMPEAERIKDGGSEGSGPKAPGQARKNLKTGRAGKSKRETGRKKPAPREKKRSVWQEITDSGNQKAAAHVWRELLYLLSRAKPRKVQADLSFSAGDPALTGEITGALSLLPFVYGHEAHVCPDFLSDKCYVRGSLALRGHMAVFHFVRSFFRLFRDKGAVRLYHKIMQKQ